MGGELRCESYPRRRARGPNPATGASVEEAESQIREAIEFHLDGMREDGIAIPQPASRVEYVEIAA